MTRVAFVLASFAFCAQGASDEPTALPSSTAELSAEDMALLERIHAAAAARNARLHSCRVAWTEFRTYGRGSLSFGEEFAPGAEVKEKVECRLLAQGRSMRSVGPHISIEWDKDWGLVFGTSESAYDGERSATLTRHPDGRIRGRVHDVGRLEESISVPMIPLMAWLRFDDARVTGRSLSKLRIVNRKMEVAGRPCVEVAGPHETLCLDLERDFLLVRWKSSSCRDDAAIEYHRPQGEWLPQSWTLRSLDQALAPAMVTEARVLKVQLDLALEPTDFALPFPAGTRVYDAETRKEKIVTE